MLNCSVEYIDHMGSDLRVVNVARVSMEKWIDEECNLIKKDEDLIKYCAKNNHWSVFSHCIVSLRYNMPIAIARQHEKHRIACSRTGEEVAHNEVSRRYVKTEPKFFIPAVFRKASENIKQGSLEEEVDKETKVVEYYNWLIGESMNVYNWFIKSGVCPEQARLVLPQCTITSFVETGSLATYARIYKLRSELHAQREMQWFANEVGNIIQPLFPISWGALTQ
jgi:thymidylate synthase (FAD)